eukprot:15771566-Heterocapsa_arctica.AAC.1
MSLEYEIDAFLEHCTPTHDPEFDSGGLGRFAHENRFSALRSEHPHKLATGMTVGLPPGLSEPSRREPYHGRAVCGDGLDRELNSTLPTGRRAVDGDRRAGLPASSADATGAD